MTPDHVWRYVPGTIALVVAIGLSIAACFGVGAEASTYKTEILGAKIEGSSVVVLSIVVFVAAAVILLRAKKETPAVRAKHRRRRSGKNAKFLGYRFLHYETTTELIGDFIDGGPPVWLRRYVNISLIVTAMLIVAAVGITTRLL